MLDGLGSQVTIVQCAGQLLMRDIADADGEILEENGIGITLDSKVQRLEKMGDGHEDRRRRNRGAGKSCPSCCREITPTRLKETGPWGICESE